MNAKDILLAPIYGLQVFSGAKSFEKNPILGSSWLNRKGLHVARVRWAAKMADWRRRNLSKAISKEHIEQYEQNGFVVIKDFLTADVFEAVKAEIDQGDMLRHDMLQGSAITRRGSLDDHELVNRPALMTAKTDSRMKNLVRYVASHGGEPLLTLQTVLALPGKRNTKGAVDPQTMLHSDTFHSTAKCWLFLTDVGEEDGPFSYVKGSHKMTPERYAWEQSLSEQGASIKNTYSRRGSLRISQDELETLGYPLPTKMIVSANTLVVADTHGFHARCSSPKPTTRIEIYGSLRRNPFLPFSGLHIASLPFIRKRSNSMVIKGLAALEKMGIRSTPWRDEGRGRVGEWPDRLKKMQSDV